MRPLIMAMMLPCACASPGGTATAMSATECSTRLQALQAQTDAAWAQTAPAREAYRSNPTSFEAKAAVELALQRAARVAADNVQAAAELAAGPCKDDRPG
ncbi:MAG: hypothetical protein U0T03_05250 [Xanthomonadales bacterium]|nr:hypothetical protein [Xanthomonadales bacterium]